MSDRRQKGPTAEPALQSAISKRSVIVAVLLPVEAGAAPLAKLNAHQLLTLEL